MSDKDCGCVPSEGLWYALAATTALAMGVQVMKRRESSGPPRGPFGMEWGSELSRPCGRSQSTGREIG